MFLVFVAAELFLLVRFIVVPLIYLFRLKKGLSNKEASRIIGKHFPEVDDKLLNLLDLAENKQKTELLMASMEQRADALGPVPFADAVKISENFKYAKYVVIPIFLLALIWVSGNIASFFDSHLRVVNYDMAYERPAPFQFILLNEKLEILDNESLKIDVRVQGEFVPEEVTIVIDGEPLLMKQQDDGIFTYTVQAPVSNGTFFLTANGWSSKAYDFISLATPAVLDFKMELRFPKYLKRKDESVVGTGNAVVPEGTSVTWKIKGRNVGQIRLLENDSSTVFGIEENEFRETRTLFESLKYQLSTSNAYVEDFEKLDYTLEVVRDNRPTVKVEQFLDSLNPNQSFYSGQAADDHGVSEIRLVYYPTENRDDKKQLRLEAPNNNVHQFYYTFPTGLKLEEGKDYELYFEVVDNDGIRNGKVVRSQVFKTSIYNRNQLISKELEYQNSLLDNMDKELKNYKEQKEGLSNINKEQREKRSLSFEDKGRIRQFLEKQERQEELMKKFSNALKENLENNEGDEETKRLLKERLERQEKEAAKNQKLLEELNKLAEKIEKEELQRKLEEFGKKQSSNARNLEQILELTKRYYVSEKAAQLSRELDDLGDKQKQLSEEAEKEESLQEQQSLNEKFNKISEELEELRKDNADLKKPMDIESDKKDEDRIKDDQKGATEELSKAGQSTDEKKKEAESKASQKQKSAGNKMKEMSRKLEQGAMSGGGSSVTEDAEMLRQILDNLVTFSFKQENLFDRLEASDFEIDNFANTVREQKELRRMFEHVDDSLFALSLRRAELAEFVNEQITEVYYNIDKTLESIAESQVYRGASYQQYVMNAANSLADFLANILDNMQQNMKAGQGQGEGSGFQLPDIIQGQQGIQEKMQNSGEGEKNQQGGEQQGKEGQNGKGEQGDREDDNQEGKGGRQNGESDKDGQGNGDEMGLEEVYEIYKEQQFLRQQLEKQLENMIDNSERELAKKLMRQMEDFENDLLENGITERTRNKANIIQHQLLRLANAELKQGKTNERESRFDRQEFVNPVITKPDQLKEAKNRIEILNRQALPLRQNFEKKVKVYFEND